ncbi:MAG: hypothetical protein IAC78_02915 [Firmicutes bacterium]|uniref:Uncharacterized protein n=1 Tax=Candidatus Scatoplasma merdavium TaxID=2840932 RepID=A0A9D9GRR7_9BACL|nr:hypothetical protein [Candidatus Scatoplasma merdavium]
MKIEIDGRLKYDSLLSLAKDAYKYPARFNRFFNSSAFEKALYETDKKKYLDFIKLKNNGDIPDIFVFKVSYLLNPYMSLRYRGFKFDNYKSIGEQMLSFAPVVDVYLKDLLIYHLLSNYMVVNKEDKRYPKCYEAVIKSEKDALINENMAYWSLAFDLAETKTLTYNGMKFKEPKEFFKYILSFSSLIPFTSSFLDDCCLLSWLVKLGYQNKIDKFIALSQSSDQLDNETNEILAKQLIEKFNNKE